MLSRQTLLSLATATLGLSWASQSAAQSFEVLETRLAQHPSLAALTYQTEASTQRSIAATALPDPVISLGINNFPVFDPSFTDFLPTNKAIGMRQDIPSPARRRARAGAEDAQAKRTALIREAQLATLRGELIASLHDKARIQVQRRYAHERSALYDDLIEVLEGEVSAGRPAVFRLAEVDAERTRVDIALLNLERQAASVTAQLIDLVGLDPDTPAPTQAPAVWDGDPMIFHGVRVANAGTKIAGFGVEEAEAGWRPNWGAQLTYQQRETGASFAGDDWMSAMVTVSVPLWAKKSQTPRLKAAKAKRSSAEMQYQAAARAAAARYASRGAAWRAADGSIAALRRNIAAVEAKIEAQRRSYEAGAGDYAPLIDGQITILSLRADLAGQVAQKMTEIARMNALMVTP